jgi:ATP-dependent RNA helicase DDX3X
MADPFNTQTMSAALAGTGSAEQGDKAWIGVQAFDYAAMTKAPDDQQWDGHARVYEWKEEFGDVGPELPELEFELFGPPSEREDKAGLDFSTSDLVTMVVTTHHAG